MKDAETGASPDKREMRRDIVRAKGERELAMLNGILRPPIL